jgi:heme A synthase
VIIQLQLLVHSNPDQMTRWKEQTVLHGLLAAALLQMTLGISTLLLHVPVRLAVMHQGGALLLLTVVIYARHRMMVSSVTS